MDRITWTNEKRKISDLSPAEYNPRQLTEKQAKDLDASLERFNLCDPIIINADNKIIGGHQRINILKQRGAVEVDVRVPSRQLTEHEEKELNLRLNKNLGEWDFDLLADFDQEMLLDVGFDSAELDKMFQLEPDAKDDEVPEPPEAPISKTGDIWILGRHRVMCGDSTKIDDVEKLMDGKKANIAFTSPPYNLGVSAKLRGNTAISKKGNVYEGYDDNSDGWIDLMNMFQSIALENAEYSIVNVQSLAGNRSDLWEWAKSFSQWFCDIAIWDKGHSAPAVAKNVMNSVVEFLFIHSKQNPCRAIRTANFRGTVDNIFRVSPQRNNAFAKIHGATMPCEFAEKIVITFSAINMIILDLFCGTGTTIIACEKTNRICYGMEINPKYCDVIVKRWEYYTNGKAIKM
jgi:ParB family chromosome partitioning protein